MNLPNAIAWAEELLSRRTRGFDYPEGVPAFQDVKIWLARVQGRSSWKELAREYYPKFSVGRAKSAVRRSFGRVERYLTDSAALRRMYKKDDPVLVRARLSACHPTLARRKTRALLLVEHT